ncbi:uncharacterized protein [Macrobrachium rosenbergii]|uniref:uncharacterized protein n=1 Tax=Macrobrachium rosenbergii TaxID=79674 RepID=UPI0034D42857
MREAAKGLRSKLDIIIRKGDKSSVYVVMKQSDYFEKIGRILLETSKFQHLTKDPTKDLRKKMSRLVTGTNNQQDIVKFPKVKGNYGPGYCYGTLKTHKAGNPLRPIISQMTSPTYRIGKVLNDLLAPYIPGHFSLKSAVEFIDLLHEKGPEDNIASLRKISISLDRVYRSDKSPLPISEDVLRDMLKASTMAAPFLSHQGKLFRQVARVAMRSPLGVLFANVYMATIEERTFREYQKPKIYGRCIDDIFVTIKETDDDIKLTDALKRNSVLNFTTEHNQQKTLPFLYVLVKQEEDSLK